MDPSISAAISYDHLSPLSKLKLMQGVPLVETPLSPAGEMGKLAFQRERFIIEKAHLIVKLQDIINFDKPALFSDKEIQDAINSLHLIRVFNPDFSQRIQNIIAAA